MKTCSTDVVNASKSERTPNRTPGLLESRGKYFRDSSWIWDQKLKRRGSWLSVHWPIVIPGSAAAVLLSAWAT